LPSRCIPPGAFLEVMTLLLVSVMLRKHKVAEHISSIEKTMLHDCLVCTSGGNPRSIRHTRQNLAGIPIAEMTKALNDNHILFIFIQSAIASQAFSISKSKSFSCFRICSLKFLFFIRVSHITLLSLSW